jgi:hypothetical protein
MFGRAEWEEGTRAKHEYLIPKNVQYRKEEEIRQMGKSFEKGLCDRDTREMRAYGGKVREVVRRWW